MRTGIKFEEINNQLHTEKDLKCAGCGIGYDDYDSEEPWRWCDAENKPYCGQCMKEHWCKAINTQGNTVDHQVIKIIKRKEVEQ